MSTFQNKIKRQIEILSLALDNRRQAKPIDVAEEYRCEELTIKRDLQELRSHGFDLHSERREGIRLTSPLKADDVRWLVMQYIALGGMDTRTDRATSLLVRKLRERALLHVVRLQRSIDRCCEARIGYRKDTAPERHVDIHPLQIFQSDSQWRVLARHEGTFKQYLLNKITGVEEREQRFSRPPQEEIDTLLRHSFRSWIGGELHRVSVHFDRKHAAWVRGRQFTETQELVEHSDGSVVFEATVNSLDEVAAWIAGLGQGVRAVEPQALRKRVIALAEGTLRNYRGGARTPAR